VPSPPLSLTAACSTISSANCPSARVESMQFGPGILVRQPDQMHQQMTSKEQYCLTAVSLSYSLVTFQHFRAVLVTVTRMKAEVNPFLAPNADIRLLLPACLPLLASIIHIM